jgi:uncharacterized protein YuzE
LGSYLDFTIIFADALVAESDEDKPGIILDYDAAGNLVSLEILDASHRVKSPSQIEYKLRLLLYQLPHRRLANMRVRKLALCVMSLCAGQGWYITS